MFTAGQRIEISYRDPWQSTFEDRLFALCSRERRIAYFYERPDTSIFRYRVFNMIDALDAAPQLGISASWFTLEDLPYMESFIDRADALVICRSLYGAGINRMVTRARARNTRVFFDIDDFVFDPAYIHLIVDTLAVPQDLDFTWNYWFAYVGRLCATLHLCDEALVTNTHLAQRVRQIVPHMKTHTVPNFMNRQQQEISASIWNEKFASGFARDSKIHIGYFSGTATHNRDFEIVAPALALLLEQDPRLIVRLVGLLEPTGSMLQFHDRIETFPLQDFLNLQKLIGQVEINLAPLQDNVFTNCKSELKYFEAAIVGTTTVASPTFTFQNAIRNGENGFLANAHEWERAIRTAIETVSDPIGYSEMAHRSYLHAKDNYSWNIFGSRIASAVFGDKMTVEQVSTADLLEPALNQVRGAASGS